MDQQRFDSVTRSSTRARSRRAAQRLLGGGDLGGLLARLAPAPADAVEVAAGRCAHPGRRWQRGYPCCSGGVCLGKRRHCQEAGTERSGDMRLVP